MKEIKSRGRRLDNKAWVYGALFAQGGKAYIITDLTPLGFIKYEVDPATGGQYWRRINGKELFEGDIFRFKTGRGNFVRIVSYSEEMSAFCIINPSPLGYKRGTKIEASWWQKFVKDIEIIGNIHDDPELLKTE